MQGIARMGTETIVNAGPVGPVHPLRSGIHIVNVGGHPFEAPYIGHHLIVVAVAVPALHGLYVAALLLTELIGESIRLLLPHLVSSGYPFVPARDKDELGVNGQGIVPLLLEVQA